MSRPPKLVVIDPDALAAVAGVLADRCLFIARAMETNAAVDIKLTSYAPDLAAGTRALVNELPTWARKTLAPNVDRLQNALDAQAATQREAA